MPVSGYRGGSLTPPCGRRRPPDAPDNLSQHHNTAGHSLLLLTERVNPPSFRSRAGLPVAAFRVGLGRRSVDQEQRQALLLDIAAAESSAAISNSQEKPVSSEVTMSARRAAWIAAARSAPERCRPTARTALARTRVRSAGVFMVTREKRANVCVVSRRRAAESRHGRGAGASRSTLTPDATSWRIP